MRVSLGKSIAKHRQALGLSQYELARRSGINPQTLQRIESGESKDPGVSYIVRIAKTLGVSVESLVEEHAPATRSRVRDPFAEIEDLQRRVGALEKQRKRSK